MSKRLRNDPERLKEIMGKPSKGFINAIRQFNELLAKQAEILVEIIERDKAAFSKEYKRLLPTMEPYLKSRGLPLPSSPEKAYQIFVLKVLDENNIEGLGRTIEQRDLKAIGEILLRELDRELSEDTIKRIQVFADQGRSENKPACIALLTEFEKGINIWGPIKNKSAILRGIKDEGVFDEVVNLPTDKVLTGYIDSYRTAFYPDLVQK